MTKQRIYNDHISIQKQKQILTLREELLDCEGVKLTESRLKEVNSKMFEQLRQVSPAGLKPILIRRNSAEWIAAYLVQEIGAGGHRILLKHKNKWELFRVRKSAEIVPIKKEQLGLFEIAVQKQIEYLHALGMFFNSKVKKELTNV
jgi:hypothetical protein